MIIIISNNYYFSEKLGQRLILKVQKLVEVPIQTEKYPFYQNIYILSRDPVPLKGKPLFFHTERRNQREIEGSFVSRYGVESVPTAAKSLVFPFSFS